MLAVALRKTAWTIMLVLALAISGYAFAYFFIDQMGGDLKAKFMTIPVSAYAHIWGGGLALALGPFQLNTRFRNRYINLHRWMGRAYLLGILVGGLGGFRLALVAEGGFAAQVGFGLMAVLWLYTGGMAYWRIRQGDTSQHQQWMTRNYALTLAAVTLRIYLPLSMGVLGMPFLEAYVAIAWFCWVPNLLVAEWFFVARQKREAAMERALVPEMA